jgi:uncharacterized cupredoxin-like copper-binding protein
MHFDMNLSTRALIAAAISLAAFNVSAYAAKATTVVHVSLEGEADQPMKITPDAASVKAGAVEFDIKNDAIGTDHEVVLVKLKSKDQKISDNAKTDRIDESKLDSMGEVAGLKPGATGKLKVKLAAGDYMLLCNHKGHFHEGMYTAFTVTN